MENVAVKQQLQKKENNLVKKNVLKLVGIGPLLILLCVIMSLLNPAFLSFSILDQFIKFDFCHLDYGNGHDVGINFRRV